MLDPKLVAAKWYVGELPGEQMPEIACQALEQGRDGKNLRYLAGLSGPIRRDIVEIVDRALRELGVETPITKREAALSMARRVASEITEGFIEPFGGACRIWLSYAREAFELEAWSELVINYEVAAELGGIEKATDEIIRAARKLASTGK